MLPGNEQKAYYKILLNNNSWRTETSSYHSNKPNMQAWPAHPTPNLTRSQADLRTGDEEAGEARSILPPHPMGFWVQEDKMVTCWVLIPPLMINSAKC